MTIPATVEGKPFLLGGDIILAVLPAGSSISVTVLRDGREVTLTAVKD